MTHIQRETQSHCLSQTVVLLLSYLTLSAMEGKTADRKDKEDRERKEREDERERQRKEREGGERQGKERGRMEYEGDQESQSLLYLGKSSLKKIKLKFG